MCSSVEFSSPPLLALESLGFNPDFPAEPFRCRLELRARLFGLPRAELRPDTLRGRCGAGRGLSNEDDLELFIELDSIKCGGRIGVPGVTCEREDLIDGAGDPVRIGGGLCVPLLGLRLELRTLPTISPSDVGLGAGIGREITGLLGEDSTELPNVSL